MVPRPNMKATVYIFATCLMVILESSTVTGIICQESKCEVEQHSEHDCLNRYLARHLNCGSAKTVCSKTLLYNSTRKGPRIETTAVEIVLRYPLVSVIRKCDTNEKNFPINDCTLALHMSPPNNAVICLCNTDFCNNGNSLSVKSITTGLLLVVAGTLSSAFLRDF